MTAILTQPAAAAEALRAGSAVVFPNPYPLTSVVAATAPDVVNTAKGRPADQAVALWLVDDDPWSSSPPPSTSTTPPGRSSASSWCANG